MGVLFAKPILIFTLFSFVRKNKQTDKQTEKQTNKHLRHNLVVKTSRDEARLAKSQDKLILFSVFGKLSILDQSALKKYS